MYRAWNSTCMWKISQVKLNTESTSSCLVHTLYACDSERYSENYIHVATICFFMVLSSCFLFVSICIDLMKFSQLQNIKSGLYPCLARLVVFPNCIRRLYVLKCLNEQIPTSCFTKPPLIFFEKQLNTQNLK